MRLNVFFKFFKAFIINAFLYGVIAYFMNIFEYPNEFWFNVIFFGIGMGIFQVLVLFRFNKNK